MSKKLTSDIINQRLNSRGISMVGVYTNLESKSDFECNIGHQWTTFVSAVLRGNGCPHCSKKFPWTKKSLNEHLESRGIKLLGELQNVKTKTEFECHYGHRWLTTATKILSGSACHHCAGNGSLTKETINERLGERNIIMISDYLNTRTKSLFRCSEGHEWTSNLNNVLSGTNCPHCAQYGFNLNKESSIYLIDYGTHLKYGISNNIQSRLSTHKKSGKYEIVKIVECSGIQAIKWENMIKCRFGGRYVNKTTMPDGYTETLSTKHKEAVVITMSEI